MISLGWTQAAEDGKCMIELYLVPGSFSAVASLNMIAFGLLSIIKDCVVATPSHQGGSITLGKASKSQSHCMSITIYWPWLGDGRLYGTVASYKSEALCYGLIVTSIQDSCQSILDTMPASSKETTFGPQSDPSAMVKLPYILRSRECFAEIFAKWYSWWDQQRISVVLWQYIAMVRPMIFRGIRSGALE